jgi:hypothetical protein
VFVRHGTGWHQQVRLAAGDAAANDELGTAVALRGSTALVGAPGKNSSSGAVYVLVQGGASWSQQVGPTASDAMAGDQFSFSLAASGASAVVGAPGKDSGSGAAYVFVQSGAGWLQQARLSASDGAAGDRFGFSLALSGSAAVVGAPQKDGGTGAAYVFVRRGTGWLPQVKLRASDGAGGD